MNLAEFRKALSSDATEENAQLKKQLSDLQTKHHEKLSKLENENNSLKESCQVLFAISNILNRLNFIVNIIFPT